MPPCSDAADQHGNAGDHRCDPLGAKQITLSQDAGLDAVVGRGEIEVYACVDAQAGRGDDGQPQPDRCLPVEIDHCHRGTPSFVPSVDWHGLDAVPVHLLARTRTLSSRDAERVEELVAERIHRPDRRRGLGNKPLCQCHGASRLTTLGSCATIEIGTSWVAVYPLTVVAGWWSPSSITTRFLSCTRAIHDVSASIEYRIDCP